VSQRGVVWNTSPNPTTSNSGTLSGSGNGPFTAQLNELTPNSTYYVRAYAINSSGTAYGNELNFTTTSNSNVNNDALNPQLNYGTVSDIQGNSYATIVIGEQEWMAENLRVTTYSNGDVIPNLPTPSNWLNSSSGVWSHYSNDTAYEIPFGKLYNWYAVSDERNVCPTGWHVPSDAEWGDLFQYLGGPSLEAEGALKSVGTEYWLPPNSNATNSSGFSGVGGGALAGNQFAMLYSTGSWWSSTEHSAQYAWCRDLTFSNGYSNFAYGDKTYGLSVRCIRD